MRILKLYIFCLLGFIFIACSNTDFMASFTKGEVKTNIKPQIVFATNVIEDTNAINTLYENSGEISINNNLFEGKYLFSNKNTLLLLPDSALNANTDYKITFDFKAINKKVGSKIDAKKWSMEFKTAELKLDVTNANFIKDSQMLDKIKLDAILEISQQIPLDKIKQYTKLLDSNGNNVEIDITWLDNKKFKISSIALNPPKDKDENYRLVFDKDIGISKK